MCFLVCEYRVGIFVHYLVAFILLPDPLRTLSETKSLVFTV